MEEKKPNLVKSVVPLDIIKNIISGFGAQTDPKKQKKNFSFEERRLWKQKKKKDKKMRKIAAKSQKINRRR